MVASVVTSVIQSTSRAIMSHMWSGCGVGVWCGSLRAGNQLHAVIFITTATPRAAAASAHSTVQL